MTEALQKFSFYGGLLGVLEGACIGWRSITEIIRCRSSFATARKRKQAFFLLVLNRKSLASLEIWVLYRSLVWGGLVLCWFITEMDRNDGSITEIFFLLGVLDWALGGCLYGLEKHYRNISCFARNLGSGLGRLSGSGLSGAGYYRNGQKLQKHYRNFLSLGGLLAGALGGRLYWVLEVACIGWRSITEIIRCRSSFATARKRKQAFFLLVLNRKSLSCFARNLGVCMGRLSGGEGAWFCIGGSGLGGFHSFVCFFYYFCHLPMGNALGRGLCGTMRIEPLKMTHLSAFFIS